MQANELNALSVLSETSLVLYSCKNSTYCAYRKQWNGGNSSINNSNTLPYLRVIKSLIIFYSYKSTQMQSNSLSSFQKTLENDTETVPEYFYHGNRYPQAIHARLRTNCSSLNNDLHSKKHVGQPSLYMRS